MRAMKKIKWLVNDLGLNELDAWWRLVWTAALMAAGLNTIDAHTHNNVKLTKETKVIAITILAEARGEGQGGMYAVAAVIAQRAFERGRTPKEVCLKPYQFSCWNGKSLKSLEHLLKVPQAKYAIALAKNIKLLSRDFVGYANHYHNNKIKLPYWAKGQKPIKVIGNHIFYKL
ncbi:uncharacterized protein METZ01_LOCUS219638 [marine metagenome]|uniref:Cell wall hydrolase SleB domain-containing protein n=1 Tax=marine metagenome TaxID=408172 RepID=A0A382FWL4_9ZZZZ